MAALDACWQSWARRSDDAGAIIGGNVEALGAAVLGDVEDEGCTGAGGVGVCGYGEGAGGWGGGEGGVWL